MSVSSAMSDTCMFMIGTCIGIIINYTVAYLETAYNIERKYELFSIGVLQILVNALIIQYIRSVIENIGLFTLGLLTSQTLIIRKCYI